jgi:hypothetical protein
MGTIDLTQGNTVTRLTSDQDKPVLIHLARTRDFGVAANSVSNGDVLQMIPIPAGMLVMGAYCKSITPETSVAQLGDGDDTDGYLATAFNDLNTTATNISNGTSAYGARLGGRGKFYPIADTLDMIPKATLNSAKVRVGCWGFMVLPPDVAPI